MNISKKRWSICAVVLVTAIIVCGAIFTVGVRAKEDENAVIADRVYIGEIPVSGMTAEEATEAVEEYIEGLSDKGITLEAGEKSIEVTSADLGVKWGNTEIAEKAVNLGKTGNLISRYKEKKDLEKGDKVFALTYDIDKSKAKALLKENKSNLNQDAQNNGLKLESGKFVYVEGHEGVEVNIDKSVTDIAAYMNQKWDGKEATVTLNAELVEPKGSQEELAKVQDLLGAYSTDFSSSAAGRAKNVKNGASRINGTILYPGDEFSVHDAVTPFNEENGYALAGSYENGTTVETYGGGICQVSTTLYNAVIRAELEITERHAHSMIVGYVEPSMDAAISGEYKDLKFKNTTDAPVYLEGYTENGIIHFNVYGEESREAGRKVEFVSETISETDPGVQYVADGTLPIGTITTSQQTHIGKKAKLWKVVTVNGTEKSREVFNSSTYQASPKIVNVGTMSANASAVEAINAAIATQDEAAISAAAAANCDDAVAAAQAQAQAEAAAAQAQAQAAEAQAKEDDDKKEQTDESKKDTDEETSKNQ